MWDFDPRGLYGTGMITLDLSFSFTRDPYDIYLHEYVDQRASILVEFERGRLFARRLMLQYCHPFVYIILCFNTIMLEGFSTSSGRFLFSLSGVYKFRIF